MAKVSFTKLNLTKNQGVQLLKWNEQDIEVKQYLPINDKLNLIANVINAAHDSNKNYANPVQTDVFTSLEIIFAYTNINFTEKQKEDPAKLYDLLKGSGLYDQVVELIPVEEYLEVCEGIARSTNAIYSYQNSIFGILDTISTDYSDLQLDATSIQQALADPGNMDLLKAILTKLG